MPSWPPDVFAIAASLLQKSGAYNYVVRNWPPKPLDEWVKEMQQLGLQWRQNWAYSSLAPDAVQSWWKAILANQHSTISDIRDNKPLCEALIALCAAADEASSGFGVIPGEKLRKLRKESGEPDDVTRKITRSVNRALELDRTVMGSTLCKQIHPSRLRVLPKLHVPQSGLNIRSFSRNLALSNSDEIRPEWISVPVDEPVSESSFNLLLLPWPRVVKPKQFKAVPAATGTVAGQHMPSGFGFFTYEPEDQFPVEVVVKAIQKARDLVGSVGAVVLPELAVPFRWHEELRNKVLGENAFLIAGVAKDAESPGGPGDNVVDFSALSELSRPVDYEQSKHHRWKLDKSQIIQYGLGANLDPHKLWWEHIRISGRKLNFMAISEWLTLAVLICEDLARPDPVGDMVRAVGPNLVIALLMDGPQLTSRWSSRYATVLADDPGCSVLSLSCHGMTKLSRPPNVASRPNVVAIWKDAKSGSPIEIDIGPDDMGVVLCLSAQYLEEFTADSRSDRCTTGYPILAGIHPIRV